MSEKYQIPAKCFYLCYHVSEEQLDGFLESIINL